ncbi:ABC transporter permease family protein [Cohnella rhizosphaerae]|uniref:Carbohydrate ABC transporter permease n=1 Tax=Cohnella rhizosphaerae TaxID=1457232 RepID=A0A9X4QSP5_9BACL|nr:hypothetical protein [Cohnella rhizosphaerae]MDG0809800.1 hypothetical protein [Cohnella rhizosphaerae]
MPDSFYWGHYKKAIEKVNVLRGFFNTFAISAGSIGLMVIVSSMAGYVIARIPRKFFQFLFYFFISGMVIPLQTGMIPIFKMGGGLASDRYAHLHDLVVRGGRAPYGDVHVFRIYEIRPQGNRRIGCH